MKALTEISEGTNINIINAHNNQSVSAIVNSPTFNPIDKVAELYERLLQAEKEKVGLLKEVLKDKKQTILLTILILKLKNMYSSKDKNNFFSATNSLKKYRRADLLDDKGNPLIQELYVDLLPNEQVFKSCLTNNTTFLVGRKGTGKSTIILRLENEYRKNKEYISCYLDTKTIFESSKSDFRHFEYLSNKIPEKTLEKYLIERAFIQTILSEIINELNKQFQSAIDKVKSILGFDKTKEVQAKLEKLLNQIQNNEHLKSIELPVVLEVNRRLKSASEQFSEKAFKDQAELGSKLSLNPTVESKLLNTVEDKLSNKQQDEWENEFSQIFLKVFQIKGIIKEVKEILSS